MSAPTLDHVGFVAPRLAPLVESMRRLGFATTAPRPLLRVDAASGASVPLHQESCHAVFASGYVELSAVLTDDPAHHLAAWRARGTGLHILALGSEDPDADFRRCSAAGLPCSAPADAGRRIEYGARHGDARFRWFMLRPEASPEGLLCWVRNLVPELVFQPEVTTHPNGVLSLDEVVLQVNSPGAVAQRLALASGLVPRQPGAVPARDAAKPQAGSGVVPAGEQATQRFELGGGGALTIATPEALRERFGADALAGVATGRYAALGLRVRDLAVAAALLRGNGVACERRGAELVVPAAAACGAVLALRE